MEEAFLKGRASNLQLGQFGAETLDQPAAGRVRNLGKLKQK